MSRLPTLARVKTLTRRTSIATIAAGIPCGLWAGYVEPGLLGITHKDLTLPHWPKALDGFRVAQLTDLHYQPDTDDELMEKLIKAIHDEAPDLILITGDYINRDRKTLLEFSPWLKKLSAPHGIFASAGNHDVWHCSNSYLRRHIESAGIAFLQNQSTTLSIKGERIYLAGLDSIWGGHPDAQKTWKAHKKGDPVLALVHEPDAFDFLYPNHPISLQLSGHTHAGQCRVPFIGYAPVKIKYGRNYEYGHYQKNHSQLWVGRGIGTGGLRVRFACSPELVMLTLRA